MNPQKPFQPALMDTDFTEYLDVRRKKRLGEKLTEEEKLKFKEFIGKVKKPQKPPTKPSKEQIKVKNSKKQAYEKVIATYYDLVERKRKKEEEIRDITRGIQEIEKKFPVLIGGINSLIDKKLSTVLGQREETEKEVEKLANLKRKRGGNLNPNEENRLAKKRKEYVKIVKEKQELEEFEKAKRIEEDLERRGLE